MTVKLTIIFVAVFICGGIKCDFPEDPKPCKYGDSECIGKLFDYFMKEKHEGDTNYNLESVDPLNFGIVHISRGSDSPVNINCEMANAVGYGIKTLRFERMKGFGKEIAGKHEISGNADYLELKGDYNITGSVLILPIKGTGKFSIYMDKPIVRLGWTGAPYEKDGATYMKVQKFYVILEPKNMRFSFENLYNSKELSDNMNKFLTENWMDIYPEVKAPLFHDVSIVAGKIVNRLFAKYPYEKYFIDTN
ncbi:protein takeout-like [Musca autumnalis]|uniref:protein takeout-like n=1 Tax=Musca autumnalis TaxID=221902 RepID=UPI003CF303CE